MHQNPGELIVLTKPELLKYKNKILNNADFAADLYYKPEQESMTN